MINQRPEDDAAGKEFALVAAIRKPVAFFAGRFGIDFRESIDDLGPYDIALLSLNDGTLFQLSRYHGGNRDYTDIFLDMSVRDPELIEAYIASIAHEFGVNDQIVFAQVRPRT